MCGIIGYNGHRPCVDIIYSGLKKLEYRGYDSSGIAVLANDRINLVKQKGKLEQLRPFIKSLPQTATLGMGHTRWATHGMPSTENAHPHGEQRVSIVHNGILENYKELKIELLEKGKRFLSETDSEVIVHLLNDELEVVSDVRKAILNIVGKLRGAYALGVLVHDRPEEVYVVKHASPLVLGIGDNENFFASDALALLGHTKEFIFLDDGEIARVGKDAIEIWDFFGAEIELKSVILDVSEAEADKNGYRHYMLKEIYDQPHVLSNTIQRLWSPGERTFNTELLGHADLDLARVEKIHIVGCGTAYYAGMIGKYALEPILGISVDVELASEFRYRNPFVSEKTLLISVTQSGETADTLACVKHAKARGCQTMVICNVRYSSIPRESDFALYMEAGPEIGVASTKAFSSMVLNFYLFGLAWAHSRERLDPAVLVNVGQSLALLPNLLQQALAAETAISVIAGKYFEDPSCLFVGRGFCYPLALEGALKLKEISYIHAEGYAAGELKHGPIALIDKTMPVIAVVPPNHEYDKILSNLEEIFAREGRIIGVGDPNDEKLMSLCEHILPCPSVADPALQVLLSSVSLQLFAYFMAVHRGTDVDQPRNLAKSVTVE